MSPRTLLLEDDPSIRDVLDLASTDDGHAVVVCTSAEHLRALSRESAQSLAVVDFWLDSQRAL